MQYTIHPPSSSSLASITTQSVITFDCCCLACALSTFFNTSTFLLELRGQACSVQEPLFTFSEWLHTTTFGLLSHLTTIIPRCGTV